MTNADRARAAYVAAYGTAPDLLMRAPGRVNLIGEHTDYNDGFVLPCAIDRDTVVAAGRTNDGMLDVVAADFAGAVDVSPLSAGFSPSPSGWADYPRAVAAVLIEHGLSLPGARLAMAGDVPLGSGLSSSASVEVAVGSALAALGGLKIAPAQLALLAQRAENVHVGCNCGIMDQLISACGQANHALLIDCRSLVCRPVPIPDGVAIVIAHCGIVHANNDGAYNERRRECEEAARHYGVTALRDLSPQALAAGKPGLAETSYRRARHVVTENARTLAAADALVAGDLGRMGRLMAQSHASMRDDFEITLPAIDGLVAIMQAAIGDLGGARMTGGGFGGCVVGLMPDDRVAAVRAAIEAGYTTPDGKAAAVFVCKASGGARAVE